MAGCPLLYLIKQMKDNSKILKMNRQIYLGGREYTWATNWSEVYVWETLDYA